MRETSRLAGLSTLTMRGVDSLVSRLRSDGRVPDLRNARVCVLGASHPNPERFRITRRFRLFPSAIRHPHHPPLGHRTLDGEQPWL